MKKLYDVYKGKEWIGAILAHSPMDAIYYLTGPDHLTNGYTAILACNTRICSDGRSV